MAVIILCAGCTNLRPIEGSSNELQQRIESGELLQAGDRVLIVTADNKLHRFAITHIGAGSIVGRRQSVAVDQVISVKKRQFSRGKTVALIVGVAAACAVGGFIAYAATHLSIGSF